MFISWLVFCFLKNEVVPIKVSLGDPVLPIHVNDLNGHNFLLDQVFEEGLCFFLAPDCPECRESIENISKILSQDLPCFFVFVDYIPADYLKMFSRENPTFFVVKGPDLETYKIATFPALLIYHSGKLVYAFHGPMPEARVEVFRAIFLNYNKENTE